MNEHHEQVTAAMSEGWVAGGSFFSSIMAGTLLGWGADHFLGTAPLLIVLGIIAGSISGFYQMWRVASPGAGGGHHDDR